MLELEATLEQKDEAANHGRCLDGALRDTCCHKRHAYMQRKHCQQVFHDMERIIGGHRPLTGLKQSSNHIAKCASPFLSFSPTFSGLRLFYMCISATLASLSISSSAHDVSLCLGAMKCPQHLPHEVNCARDRLSAILPSFSLPTHHLLLFRTPA